MLSIGRRCMEVGWSFYWEPYEPPYVIHPNGKTVACVVEGNVPYTPHRPLRHGAACVCSPYTRASQQSSKIRQPVALGCLRSSVPIAQCGGDAHGISIRDSPVAAPAAEIAAPEELVEEDGVPSLPDHGVDSPNAIIAATSLEHLMTPLPKNAHCSACQRAKW